jgi:glycine cleavage system H protein
MAEFPGNLKYASSHEWALLEDDGTVTVGISDHAQEALGDVVYVEMPELGQEVEAGSEAGVVESVKAASDILTPVSGEVIEINEALEDAPEKVNESPFGEGWFYKIKPNNVSELDQLLDAAAYEKACENE